MPSLKLRKKQKFFSNNLAENVTKLLDSHQISEGELAKNLNIPYNTINRILTGVTADPRISTLELIANYFGVNLDFLLGKNIHSEKIDEFNIPVLNWELVSQPDFLKKLNRNEWEQWIPIAHFLEDNLSIENVFALESTKSMHPRFPLGTTFIIITAIPPKDGDLVLIKFKTDGTLSLRELIIDSPNWQLNPIVLGSRPILFSHSEHTVLGVVVLTLIQTR